MKLGNFFRSVHVQAWAVVLAVLIVYGCSNGSGGFDDSDGFLELEQSGDVGGLVRLAPNTKVVPMDGSVVVDGVGDLGIQFRGLPINNANTGDNLIIVAPITDEARARINHQGGFQSISESLHIIPTEKMPASIIGRGGSEYSHYVVAFQTVVERVIDAGPLAIEGAQTFAAPNLETRHWIHSVVHSVTHSVSRASKSITKGVTSVGKSAERGVTSAASSVGSAVGSVANQIAAGVTSTVTQSVGAAESAVSSAASSVGGIGSAISTIRSVGASFADVVEDAALDLNQLPKEAYKIATEIKDFAEFLITGNLTIGFSDDGSLKASFDNFSVSREAGSENREIALTLSGDVDFRYTESASINIKRFRLESMSTNYGVSFNTGLSVNEVSGSGTVPIRTVNLEPLIIDIDGLPVVITRSVEITADVGVSSPINASFNGSGSAGAGLNIVFGGQTKPSAYLHGSADASVANLSGEATVALHIKPVYKLYDTGGFFLDFTLAQVAADVAAGSNEAEITISSGMGIGLTMDGLGFGASGSVERDLVEKTWKTFNENL